MELEKIIYDESNGLYYELHEDGLYYPLLEIDEEEYEIGPWGLRRQEFLEKHSPIIIQLLQMNGKLPQHLHEIDVRASELMETLTKQMAEKEAVDAKLKADEPMIWAQKTESIKKRCEEVVYKEVINDLNEPAILNED